MCRDQRGNQTIFTNEAKVKSIQSCYSQLEKIDERPDRERVNRTSPGREISREASDREKEKSQIASSPSVDLKDLVLFLLPVGKFLRNFQTGKGSIDPLPVWKFPGDFPTGSKIRVQKKRLDSFFAPGWKIHVNFPTGGKKRV